jgi:four helix bundle protein
MNTHIAQIESAGLCSPSLARSLDRLANLSTCVDRLSSQNRLLAHPSLRAQMRRASMEALAQAACAVEAESDGDYRELLRRSRGALTELRTFSRIARVAGAVALAQADELGLLADQADLSLALSLKSAATVTTRHPAGALTLEGVA